MFRAPQREEGPKTELGYVCVQDKEGGKEAVKKTEEEISREEGDPGKVCVQGRESSFIPLSHYMESLQI